MTSYNATIVQEAINIQGDDYKAVIVSNPDEVSCIQYSELFEYILAGYHDGHVRVFHNLKCIKSLRDKDTAASPGEVTCIKHRPVSKNYPISNNVICTYSNGRVKSWNYNLEQVSFTMDEKRNTTYIAYHPKLSKFVTMGDDKKIFMYDEDSQRQERVLSASDEVGSTDGHTASVLTGCFHPKSGNELLSGGLDNTIQFWDTRQRQAIRKIDGIPIRGEGLHFLPDGTQFITFSMQKEKPIRLWDYSSAKEIKVIEPDKYKHVMLKCGQVFDKNSFVCAGGEPNLVRVVDMTKYQTTTTITNIPKVNNITVGQQDQDKGAKFAFCAGKKIYEIVPK